jgi:hypothetical protein
MLPFTEWMKIATAMYAETLVRLQHSTLFIRKAEVTQVTKSNDKNIRM